MGVFFVEGDIDTNGLERLDDHLVARVGNVEAVRAQLLAGANREVADQHGAKEGHMLSVGLGERQDGTLNLLCLVSRGFV